MGYFDLILCIFLSYKNAQLAKLKGQNTIVWVTLTIVLYFVGYIIGLGIMMALMYRGPLNQEAFESFVLERPLLAVTCFAFAIGGYLMIRYILERMPNADQKD